MHNTQNCKQYDSVHSCAFRWTSYGQSFSACFGSRQWKMSRLHSYDQWAGEGTISLESWGMLRHTFPCPTPCQQLLSRRSIDPLQPSTAGHPAAYEAHTYLNIAYARWLRWNLDRARIWGNGITDIMMVLLRYTFPHETVPGPGNRQTFTGRWAVYTHTTHGQVRGPLVGNPRRTDSMLRHTFPRATPCQHLLSTRSSPLLAIQVAWAAHEAHTYLDIENASWPRWNLDRYGFRVMA